MTFLSDDVLFFPGLPHRFFVLSKRLNLNTISLETCEINRSDPNEKPVRIRETGKTNSPFYNYQFLITLISNSESVHSFYKLLPTAGET